MPQIRRILQLLQQDESKRKIAQILHSGRHTIDCYVQRFQCCSVRLPLLIKLSDTDLAIFVYSGNKDPQPDQRYEDLKSRLNYIQKELTCTGVTKLRL